MVGKRVPKGHVYTKPHASLGAAQRVVMLMITIRKRGAIPFFRNRLALRPTVVFPTSPLGSVSCVCAAMLRHER